MSDPVYHFPNDFGCPTGPRERTPSSGCRITGSEDYDSQLFCDSHSLQGTENRSRTFGIDVFQWKMYSAATERAPGARSMMIND